MKTGVLRRIGVITTSILALLCMRTAAAPAALLDSLVGAWQFNGDLTDATGNGLNLTFHGTNPASYVSGGGHTSLALDGVNQYANVAASGTLVDFNAHSFTISAWLTVHTVPTARREAYIVGRPSSSSNDDYALTVDYQNITPATDDDNLIFQSDGYTGKSPSGAANVLTNMQGPTGLGHYINMVLTYDQPTHTLTLYRNSSQRDTISTNVIGPTANASELRFGTDFLGSTFLRADLDEIEIYSASVTQAQVTTLFNGGNGPTAIPEPSAIAAAAIASAFLVNRRRRLR